MSKSAWSNSTEGTSFVTRNNFNESQELQASIFQARANNRYFIYKVSSDESFAIDYEIEPYGNLLVRDFDRDNINMTDNNYHYIISSNNWSIGEFEISDNSRIIAVANGTTIDVRERNPLDGTFSLREVIALDYAPQSLDLSFDGSIIACFDRGNPCKLSIF